VTYTPSAASVAPRPRTLTVSPASASAPPPAGRSGTTAPNKPPAESVSGRLIKDGDFEKPDEWNIVEVLWQGDRTVHIVNGRANNAVTNLPLSDPTNPGSFVPLTRGKSAIEIEVAEIWFRRIEVKAITG
jgi:hypothetical protein